MRLVPVDPIQFRRGKAGEHNISGDAAKHWVGVKISRLVAAAGIVPQNARPQHFVCGVQQRRTVHVARKADALHSAQSKGGKRIHHGFSGGDPVTWCLF